MKGFESNLKSIILLYLYIKYCKLFSLTGSQVSTTPTHGLRLNTQAKGHSELHLIHSLPKFPDLFSLWLLSFCESRHQTKCDQIIVISYFLLRVVSMNCRCLTTMNKAKNAETIQGRCRKHQNYTNIFQPHRQEALGPTSHFISKTVPFVN